MAEQGTFKEPGLFSEKVVARGRKALAKDKLTAAKADSLKAQHREQCGPTGCPINILVMGLRGSGASSFIRHVLTEHYGDGMRFRPLIGDQDGGVTRKKASYPLESKEEGVYGVVLHEAPSFTADNYCEGEFKQLLKGHHRDGSVVFGVHSGDSFEPMPKIDSQMHAAVLTIAAKQVVGPDGVENCHRLKKAIQQSCSHRVGHDFQCFIAITGCDEEEPRLEDEPELIHHSERIASIAAFVSKETGVSSNQVMPTILYSFQSEPEESMAAVPLTTLNKAVLTAADSLRSV